MTKVGGKITYNSCKTQGHNKIICKNLADGDKQGTTHLARHGAKKREQEKEAYDALEE